MRSHEQAEQLIAAGWTAQQEGRLPEAEALYKKAFEVQPGNGLAVHRLAGLALQLGKNDMAIELNELALRHDPSLAAAWCDIGAARFLKKEYAQAEAACRQAVALDPKHTFAWFNLGRCLWAQGRLEESVAAYKQSVRSDPGYGPAYNNLGLVLDKLGRLKEAEAACREAVRLNPADAQPHQSLGTVLYHLGRLRDAEQSFSRAAERDPAYPDAHFARGQVLLTFGNFREGWAEHEYRLHMKVLRTCLTRFTQPKWDGGDIAGKTLLLQVEQGLGDTLQFIRFLPEVKARAGKVILECQPPLIPLLRPLFGADELFARGQPLPDFDVHCPMMSLAWALGVEPAQAPRPPYLTVPDEYRARWAGRIPRTGRPAVGLVWAGNPEHENDRNRSLAPADLGPLLAVPGVDFYSFQKDAPAEALAKPPLAGKVIDLGAEVKDYADTAALLEQIDLLISVDTSVVHAAGALGRPVWTLLPYMPDWRWLLEREDSPWYPGMRLFRQGKERSWEAVIAQVARELRKLAAGSSLKT